MIKTNEYSVIKVAILAEEPLGWKSGVHYFSTILDGYSWRGEKRCYKIITENIYDKDILKNVLIDRDFDVLLVPGGGVGDGECLTKGFTWNPRVKKWKKMIRVFIQKGGGYVGICGGAALLTDLETKNKKKTFVEQLYNNSSLDISSVKSYYKDLAFPIFYPRQHLFPEKIGAASYVFSFRPGETVDDRKIFAAGLPVDFELDKNHEFFKGYDHKKLRIRWWGGPGLVVSNLSNKNVSILAKYPKHEFSLEKNTKIYPWIYTGGIPGLIRGFKNALCFIKNHNIDLKYFFTYLFYFAGDWKKTENDLDLDLQSKAAITCEVYPNKEKGRIFLCAAHPEYMIWEGGTITEADEKEFNCIGYGFHQWKSITHFSKSGLKELTSTWWIIRRAVAWAAKVSSKEFPPIKENDETREEVKQLAKELFWDGSVNSQIENI